jgi:hypothetical protein
METKKDIQLEELVTQMAEILVYQLWGTPTGLAKEKIDYQVRFDNKLRDLALAYAKALKAEEPDNSLVRLKVRIFNRICSLLVINKQENPDNRICASCLEEKPPVDFMNFRADPKETNLCAKCSRKPFDAIGKALGPLD